MTQTLPIIDMSALFDPSDRTGHERGAAALAAACETFGFFYLTATG